MHVIIFYQHRLREWQACMRLVGELHERGVEASVFNIDFELAPAVRKAREFGVDALVLPWMYHDDNYLLMHPFLRLNPDVLLVNVHQEQIGSPVSMRVLLPTGESAKNSVLHYVWGPRFADELKAAGVDEELITVTGSMRNDFPPSGLKAKRELAHEFDLDPDKRWLLIAESRGWVLDYSNARHEDFLKSGYSELEVKEFVEVTRASLEATICQMENLAAEVGADVEIIYRPHPGTLSQSIKNPRIRVIAAHDIHDWLVNIDQIAVWSSTTIYEAEMHGVPGVVWAPISNPSEFSPLGMERFPVATDLGDVLEWMDAQHSPTKHFEELYGPNDKRCTARVADALHRDLMNPPHGYRAQPVGFSRGLAKKMLFEMLTILSVRAGLLHKIKFPRSAYSHRIDIPFYDRPD